MSPTTLPTITNPFKNLPELMKQILLHDENTDLNIAIEKNNGLNKDQGKKMMQVIRSVILKTVRPDEIVTVIQREIGLDDRRAKKLALDLLSKRFLPMEWYIGKVQPLIQELGGNVAESLAEARQRYPEVYAPKTTPEGVSAESAGTEEHPVLRNFDERISNLKGQADILLRLTGLSSQLEKAVESGKLPPSDGERLMQELDAVSYAVNTKDLNPFEVNSIKRKIRKIINQIESAQ